MRWQSAKTHQSLVLTQVGATWRLEERAPSEKAIGKQVRTSDGKYYTFFALNSGAPAPGRGLGSLYRHDPLICGPLVGLYSVENRSISDFLSGCSLISKVEKQGEVELRLSSEDDAAVTFRFSKATLSPTLIHILRKNGDIQDETIVKAQSQVVKGVSLPQFTSFNRTVSVHGVPQSFERYEFKVERAEANNSAISVDLSVPTGQVFEEVSELTHKVTFYKVDSNHQLQVVNVEEALGLESPSTNRTWTVLFLAGVVSFAGILFWIRRVRQGNPPYQPT